MAGEFAGYLGKTDNVLTDWHGRVILVARSVRMPGLYGPDRDCFGIVWYLANGRKLVGYCLGGSGMLVRGELVYANQDEGRACRSVCEHWAEVDAEDAERFEYEQTLGGEG